MLRYRDGAAAIGWMSSAFGFPEAAARSGQERRCSLRPARLRQREGLAQRINHNEFHKLVTSRWDSGGVGSQSVHILVPEVDAYELKTQEYGGPQYSCRDPDGHSSLKVWPTVTSPSSVRTYRARLRRRRPMLAGGSRAAEAIRTEVPRCHRESQLWNPCLQTRWTTAGTGIFFMDWTASVDGKPSPLKGSHPDPRLRTS